MARVKMLNIVIASNVDNYLTISLFENRRRPNLSRLHQIKADEA